jgi:hypothetical protein
MSAIDIIAIRQPDGSHCVSPMFVRFSHKARQTTVVDVYINDQLIENFSSHVLVVPKGEKEAVFQSPIPANINERVKPKSGGVDWAIDEELLRMHNTMPPGKNWLPIIYFNQI